MTTRSSPGSRQWFERYEDGAATTDDFIATVEDVSGVDLGGFRADWLDAPTLPDEFPATTLSA